MQWINGQFRKSDIPEFKKMVFMKTVKFKTVVKTLSSIYKVYKVYKTLAHTLVVGRRCSDNIRYVGMY